MTTLFTLIYSDGTTADGRVHHPRALDHDDFKNHLIEFDSTPDRQIVDVVFHPAT